MIEAQAATPSAGELATNWDEVCKRYPDQWVTLVETDWIDPGKSDFRSTRVISRGPSHAEAVAQGRPLLARYGGYGCFYTGRIRTPFPALLSLYVPR